MYESWLAMFKLAEGSKYGQTTFKFGKGEIPIRFESWLWLTVISDPLELAVCQEQWKIWQHTSKDREGASELLSGNWQMLVWQK